MPTTQIPRGANLSLFVKKQSTFKTPATGDYLSTFAYTWGLSEQRPYQDDPLLGLTKQNTRDVTEPSQDVSTFGGQAVVPLDFGHLRYWLELALGAPETSGAGPNFTHVFSSGGVALPEATIERKMARDGGSIFLQHIGVMVDGVTIQASRQGGYARVQLDCVGYGEDKLTSTGAGTPVAAVARDPILAALGIYKKGGSTLGRVLECNLTYRNNLVRRDETGDVRISGCDVGDVMCTGSLRVRLTDMTLADEAIATTPHAGELLFSKNANRSFSWAMPIVRMERPPIINEGPGFLDITYNLRAEQDHDSAAAVMTLKGGVENWGA